MANSSELFKALKHSMWGELLQDTLKDEFGGKGVKDVFDVGALVKTDEVIDLTTSHVLVSYLRSQCIGSTSHPYMVAAVAKETVSGLRITDFLLHHSELSFPYITGEQRAFLWEATGTKRDVAHLYMFTHLREHGFTLWEMKELASRAVSTKRDTYFVLIREDNAIGMKYDYKRKEFFSVTVIG